MSKITIFKIGLAGGIYNLLSILFIGILAQTSVPMFRRFVMMAMRDYGPMGFNRTFSGVINAGFWAFVAGFIQFGLIALIFHILTSKNIITNTASKWFRSSKK